MTSTAILGYGNYLQMSSIFQMNRTNGYVWQIGETGASWSVGQVGPRAISLN